MAFALRLTNIARLVRYTNSCQVEKLYDSIYRTLSISSIRLGTVVPFKLSDIGEGIRDVTIKEWFVKPGDQVNEFDNICEVQSDKASVVITSRYNGVIKTLHFGIDDVALVGASLLDIEIEDDIETESQGKKIDKEEAVNIKQKIDKTEPKDDNSKKILTIPSVRKMAVENNIKLQDVIGTGKDGRILKEDLLAHLQKVSIDDTNKSKMSQTSTIAKTVGITGYSKHMWKTMTQSLSIPHFVYSDECNIDQVMHFRNEVKDSLKEQDIALSLMPFFIKAASRALQQYPELNAWLDEKNQALQILDSHNIGIAMDTPDGLVVPNIKNVQNLSVFAIAKELNRLQQLGKKTSIPLNDLTDTTFSLSNIGVIGGTYTKPVILPPQVVIGAFGKAQKIPRFDNNGNVIPANIISVSWAADHRVLDGVTVAKFSNLWKHYVENPVHLLIGA